MATRRQRKPTGVPQLSVENLAEIFGAGPASDGMRGGRQARNSPTAGFRAPTEPIAMPTQTGPTPQAPQMDTLAAQPTGIFQSAPPTQDMAVPAAPQIAAPMPSMGSVGLNPLTTEQGLSATPSLQPQIPTSPNVMGPEATQARLGEMFGEAPQTLSQVTAQDPASIAAREASQSFAEESAARESRLPTPGIPQDRAVRDESNMRGERQYTDSQIRDLAGGDAELMGRYKAMDEQGVDPATGQRPAAPKAVDPLERAQKQATLAKTLQDIESGQVAIKQGQEQAFEASRNNVRSTTDAFEKLQPVAEEIARLSGSAFTEGGLGWVASKLPLSTDARQIQRLTTEFEGSAFLQGLIEAKSKGATFGALSEQEGNRILAQWGKLTDPSSSNPQRINAINAMLGSIQRSAERAASDHIEKYGKPAEGSSASGASPIQGDYDDKSLDDALL
jgi:hypothetical protein